MKKLFTKILGTNVVSNQAEGVISIITGVHIDPENGKVIALQCGFKQLITPMDILKWGQYVHINDNTSLTTREHVLRLQNIPNGRDNILYKAVYTESEERIGRLYDYTIDTKAMILTSITVKKKFLWFTLFETMIPYRNIIEIQDMKIIVKDIYSVKRTQVPLTKTA